MVVWLTILAIACACLFRFRFRLLISEPLPLERRFSMAKTVTATTVLLLSPLYYEFPGYPLTSVVSFEGQKVLRHPFGKFHWEWFGGISNLPSSAFKVTSRVSPVTNNPKVKGIEYCINASIADPERFYADEKRRLKYGVGFGESKGTSEYFGTGYGFEARDKNLDVDNVLGRLVTFQMFELNELHSAELGQFFNPLDPTQVAGMKKFVEDWLNERLEKDGIEVTFQYFSINN